MTKGILLISCGAAHDALAARCINSIMRVSSLPIHIHREAGKIGFASREAKLMMDKITPFEATLYLDCDTVVLKDPSFLLDEFPSSGHWIRMAVDPATPDAKRMVVHPFYKKVLPAGTLAALASCGSTTHYNTGVILFRPYHEFFRVWREKWVNGPQLQDEPALIMAQRECNRIDRLDPRWNVLCNPEKKDEEIRKAIRSAGILHLCGLNKPKNYARITSLLAERGASVPSR